MEYKVHYNEKTGEILAYYDNTGVLDYSEMIPEPNIEITSEQHECAFQNMKQAKVIDGVFVVEDIPEPTLEEKQEEWRSNLKHQYDSDRINLGTLIMMADNEDEEKELKVQKEVLKIKYESDIAKVEQGINPFG